MTRPELEPSLEQGMLFFPLRCVYLLGVIVIVVNPIDLRRQSMGKTKKLVNLPYFLMRRGYSYHPWIIVVKSTYRLVLGVVI
jgi:hypothetical protein